MDNVEDDAVKPKLKKPLSPFEWLLQKVWPSLERLYTAGAFRAFGLCGLKVDQIEELWRRAAVKPHCWQANNIHFYVIYQNSGGTFLFDGEFQRHQGAC